LRRFGESESNEGKRRSRVKRVRRARKVLRFPKMMGD
jgi:hypothetical protein